MSKTSIIGIKIIAPVRGQVEVKWSALDGELPTDHFARVLDRVVGSLDVGPFLARAKSIKGAAGRPLLCPRMMLVLWLYAIIDGVAAATEIEELTRSHVAYRWIVGGLRTSHDVISRFRVEQGEGFSKVLSEVLARLLEAGLLDLDVVAQDGTRLRASAGAPSFRTAPALEDCREHAALHLKAVLAQGKDPHLSQTMKVSREVKAREYAARVEAAIEALSTLPANKKNAPRASTTDPDARVMKMGDGGFRPAYNVQLAVAGSELGGPRAIVGVIVTNVGSDMGSLTPMANDIEKRTGSRPETVLADSNHYKLSDLEEVERLGTRPVVPPPRPRKGSAIVKSDNTKSPAPIAGTVPVEKQPSVDEWRDEAMSPADRQLYRRRASLSELANAVLKGSYRMDQLPVRGLARVTSTITLYALCFTLHQNIGRLANLIAG